MKNNKVLITGAGGPAAINVYKSLKNESIEIHMADASHFASGLYFVESSRRHLLPLGTENDFVFSLLTTCIREKINIVIPTVDSELIPITDHIEEFEKNNIAVMLADAKSLKSTLNKHKLLEKVDATVKVGAYNMLAQSKAEEFKNKRIVIKPVSGSGSRGVLFFDSYSDIPKELKAQPDLMVQELFDGEEYSVDMIMDKNSEVIAAAPRVRLKTDSGVSVTGKIVNNQSIIEYAKKVVKAVGLSYAANVQIMNSTEGPRLVEINPRFSGGLCLSIKAGADTPKIGLDMILGKEVKPITKIEEIAMVRYYEEVYTTEI